MLISTLPSNPNIDIIMKKGDNGASKHYLWEEDSDLLLDTTEYVGSKDVLPNNAEIQATEKVNYHSPNTYWKDQKKELSWKIM